MFFDQVRSEDAIGESRVIFDKRRERELASGLVPVNHKRVKVGAPGVNSGRQSSAAAADDNDVIQVIFSLLAIGFTFRA